MKSKKELQNKIEMKNKDEMKNKYVGFMSERQFEKVMEQTMRVYKKSADEHKRLNEMEIESLLVNNINNATDGFKATFDIYGYGLTLADWKQLEIGRVLNARHNNMSIMFHLDILTSVNGWDFYEPENNRQRNRIIKNSDSSIFIYIHNMYYTGGFKPTDTREKLEEISRKYPNATVYHGYIIGKNHKTGVDIVFHLNDVEDNPKIREISGDVIYEIVTGDKSALFDTYKAVRLYLEENNGNTLNEDDENILDSYENRIFN